MGPWQPHWHIVEKGIEVGGYPCSLINLRYRSEILRAYLLADPQHLAQPLRQRFQSRRHNLAQDARPLTAAHDQQLDRPARSGYLVAYIANRHDGLPHGIAGMDGTDAVGKAQTCRWGKTGGDHPCARRQQPVGAAEHGVLLVNEGW